jgi:hypothetical protein
LCNEVFVKAKMARKLLVLGMVFAVGGCFSLRGQGRGELREIQLTWDPRNHELDNNDNFSPDDRWLVYDTRKAVPGPPMQEVGANGAIEKVNVRTGEILVLYETPHQTEYGPGVGAASYHPREDKIVCMHGLSNCDANRPYWYWRRTGVMVDESPAATPCVGGRGGRQPSRAIFLDARDVTAPFTPGALRGGTHRHEWSGDGKWIGFTYNDAIMAQIEERTGEPVNLRTIGVSTALRSVTVDWDGEGENNDGVWFSALVVKVVPHPTPGSDEISRAFSDAWVGTRGYRKADGTWQRARAFLGNVRDSKGKELTEVFVVDISDRIDIPGYDGPLGGTQTTMPMPPKGAKQRRLTYTEGRKYPGVASEPRHWVRSSADGSRISYLARDDAGITQVFFVSPLGGEPVQVTHHEQPIQSTVRWNPKGEEICYVCDNSIFICDVREGTSFGAARRVTARTGEPPVSPIWSHDGRTIAYNRSIANGRGIYKQIFLLKLP